MNNEEYAKLKQRYKDLHFAVTTALGSTRELDDGTHIWDVSDYIELCHLVDTPRNLPDRR